MLKEINPWLSSARIDHIFPVAEAGLIKLWGKPTSFNHVRGVTVMLRSFE